MKVRHVGGSNIISLVSNQKQVQTPVLAQAEGYWDGLSQGNRIPRRSDIDPRGIEGALEFAFILERIAPEVGRFRLAGMHLNDLMGMEVRGMPFTAMFLPESRKQIGGLIRQVCTDPLVATVALAGETGLGRPKMTATMFLAPLCDETGRINRLFGCLQCTGSIGRQPRRLSVRDVSIRRVGALQSTAPDTRHTYSFAAPEPVFDHPAQSVRPNDIRPTLRLVTSNT